MAKKFEAAMDLIASRNNLNMEWQMLKDDFRRARIICNSSKEMSAVLDLVHRMKGAWVDCWSCYEGEFEGYVYAMDAEEQRKMEEARRKEQQRLDEWWMRFHFADKETRRLMACGAIE